VESFVLNDTHQAMELVHKVDGALRAMQRVVSGAALLTPTILREAQHLLRGSVPESWTLTWPAAPSSPIPFLNELARKAHLLKSVYSPRATEGSILRQPVNLADFLHPEVFLNALRQQTARLSGQAVDSLRLFTSFGPLSMQGAVSVEGLYLEGCSFNPSSALLESSSRDAPQLTRLPPLSMGWVPASSSADERPSSRPPSAPPGGGAKTTVSMPVYVSLSREFFLCAVDMPTDSRQHRILNSCAVFLSEH